MLTITREQIAALGRVAREVFEDRMVEELRPTTRVPETELREQVREHIARAEEAGVREEPLVRRYVRAAVVECDPPPLVPPPANAPRSRDIGSAVQVCMHNVEVTARDEEGEAVAEQRVCIELPDGTRREVRTDGNGRAALFGVDPGQCQVTFPDADVER
jgi:hypothetical protein